MSYKYLHEVPVGKKVKLCIVNNYICIGSKYMMEQTNGYIIGTILGNEKYGKTIIGFDTDTAAKLSNSDLSDCNIPNYPHCVKQQAISGVYFELYDEPIISKSVPLFLGASLLSLFSITKSSINKIQNNTTS